MSHYDKTLEQNSAIEPQLQVGLLNIARQVVHDLGEGNPLSNDLKKLLGKEARSGRAGYYNQLRDEIRKIHKAVSTTHHFPKVTSSSSGAAL
jgi:hypothetical protein